MKYHVRRIWFLVITMVLTGIPMWLTGYQSYNTYAYYAFGILSLLSFLFILFTYCPWKELLKMQLLGFFFAWVVKVILDIREDPSNHNLLPFELVILLLVAFIVTSIGIGLALLLQFIRGRLR